MKKIMQWLIPVILILLITISFIPNSIDSPLLWIWRTVIVFALIIIYLKSIYLPARFFWIMSFLSAFAVSGFFVPVLIYVAQAFLIIFIAACALDLLLLFNKKELVSCKRILPKLFSLGDENPIKLILKNNNGLRLKVKIIDELPIQFQKRDFEINTVLKGFTEDKIVYELRPLSRGEYPFRKINLFLKSPLGLVETRVIVDAEATIPVYPSIIQMKKYELLALARISVFPGVKKIYFSEWIFSTA